MKATWIAPALAVEFADDVPTDPAYQFRCIQFDAERAFKAGDSPAKACFWAEGTAERSWWDAAYGTAKRTVKP